MRIRNVRLIGTPHPSMTCNWIATSGMCTSFRLVLDLTSMRSNFPSSVRLRMSTLVWMPSNVNAGSYSAGIEPSASSLRVVLSASRCSKYLSCTSLPPGNRCRASSPTRGSGVEDGLLGRPHFVREVPVMAFKVEAFQALQAGHEPGLGQP